MKKLFKVGDYIRHLLDEAILADTDFKYQQMGFRKQDTSANMPPDQLNIEQIEFSIYLKRYNPSFFARVLSWRSAPTAAVYELGSVNDNDITIKLSLKRTDALGARAEQVSDDLGDKYIRV